MEEEDTEMQHVDYPEPDAGSPTTPYPNLSGNEVGTTGSEQAVTQNGDAAVEETTPARSGGQNGFTTLSDYFDLGNRALWNLNRLTRNVDDGHRWIESRASGGDQPSAAQPEHRPRSNDSNGSPAAACGDDSTDLPGFHFLPDDDEPVTPIQRNSQAQIYPSTPAAFPITPSTGDASPSRGRGSGRGAGRPRGRGRGGRGWKRALKGTDHENLFKTPRLTKEQKGFSMRGRAGRKKAVPVDPEPEVVEVMKEMNGAWMNNDLDAAISIASEVIQMNPEVALPYQIISKARQAQGLELESIHALFSAAIIERNANTWVEVAKRLLAHKGASLTAKDTDAALHCLAEALKADKSNVGAYETRLAIFLDMHNYNRARKTCKSLVLLCPERLYLLKEFSELCDMTTFPEDIRGAIELYEKAFERYYDTDSFGDPSEQWTHLNVYIDLINKTGDHRKAVYQLRRIARWFLGRKEDSFWDAYTEDDREYDNSHERRYMDPRFPRVSKDLARYGDGLMLELRVKLGFLRFRMGPRYHMEGFRHLEHLRRLSASEDIQDYFDLFLDVGTFLLSFGMYGAAIDFYERVKAFPEFLDRNYWMTLGRCYREIGRNDDAEKCYETIIEANKDEVEARIALVRLHEAMSRNLKALAITDELIRLGHAEDLRKQDMATYVTAWTNRGNKIPPPARPKVPLPEYTPTKYARILPASEQAERGRATEMPRKLPRQSIPKLPTKDGAPRNRPVDTNEGDGEYMDGRERTPRKQSDAAQEPTFTRGAGYLQSLREQKTRVHANYQKVSELQSMIDENDADDKAVRQWMQHAKAMAQDFRLMDEFFPSRSRDKVFTGLRTGLDASSRKLISEMEATKKRLQDLTTNDSDEAVPSTEGFFGAFHDISFHEWHRVITTLALQYAESPQQDKCYDLLNNVLLPANVFNQDSELLNTTLAACLCCAIMFNDTDFLLQTARRLEGQHSSAIVNQLVAASGRLGYGESYLHDRKTKEWSSQAVEEQDYLAMTTEQRSQVDWGRSSSRLVEKAKQTNDTLPDLDAGILTSHAHMTSESHYGPSNAALPPLLRALALQPDSVVVNLSIATSYALHATTKPTKNKQLEIAQAIAFLNRYYDLRVANGRACDLQEAEYNSARLWHLLEMPHLAVPAYERVLALSERVREEGETGEDFAMEAAVAMRDLFVLAGNLEAARGVVEEWLIL